MAFPDNSCSSCLANTSPQICHCPEWKRIFTNPYLSWQIEYSWRVLSWIRTLIQFDYPRFCQLSPQEFISLFRTALSPLIFSEETDTLVSAIEMSNKASKLVFCPPNWRSVARVWLFPDVCWQPNTFGGDIRPLLFVNIHFVRTPISNTSSR